MILSTHAAPIVSLSRCVAASLRSTRSNNLTALHARPLASFEQCSELHRRQLHHPVFDRRPAELPTLQPLRHQTDASSVPPQQFHSVHPLGAEHEDRAAERIGSERRLHNGGEPVSLFAEVHGACCHQNLEVCSSRDHEALLTARSTATSASVSTWPMTRTTASPIAISIVPETIGDGWEDLDGDDRADAEITTGANAGASSQISGVGFGRPLPRRGRGAGFAADPSPGAAPPPSCSKARASRRHANNCCGLSPWRRATSDTLTPPVRLSTTMRALSSLDHRRRRPMPVISSIRRTSETPPPAPAALLSSLRSSLMSKSSLMGRHYATTPTPPKRGNEAPLTMASPTEPRTCAPHSSQRRRRRAPWIRPRRPVCHASPDCPAARRMRRRHPC